MTHGAVSSADRYDVVVIGAGPAGSAAAIRACELGARVAVVEARRTGGVCVNTGCVPARVLARTARLVREIRSAADYGITVGDPQVEWARTTRKVQQIIDDIWDLRGTDRRVAELGGELILGETAAFLDADHVELSSGRVLEASKFIIAIGGRPRALNVPGGDLALTLEQLLQTERLSDDVVIIGGGDTGVQLATVLDAFGCAVTLLETAPRLVMHADAEVAQRLDASFRARGIDVRLGIPPVQRLERNGDGLAVTYGAPDAEVTVRAGTVVAAVGWPTDVAALGVERAGIDARGDHIPVNAYLQSNVAHIYVVGDANGGPRLVETARSDGDTAATNAVLGLARSTPHALLPSGGFTDPDIAGVGLTEELARARDPACVVARVDYAEVDRAVIDAATNGFLKLIADRHRSVLLGAHAVGDQAVEVIQAVTTAMAAGADIATLARIEFAYPSYTAAIGTAAQRLLDTSPATD